MSVDVHAPANGLPTASHAVGRDAEPNPRRKESGPDKPVVLFVDDEPTVLSGIRTALHRHRREYTMRFAGSGAEAMRILAGEVVDVVVTDMRMPAMTGVDLLTDVRRNHPSVIRYVLSGEAEPSLVMRAVPVTHRWLTKPCDRDVLATALAEAVAHRRIVVDPVIRQALAEINTLPSPPRIYVELIELLQDPEVSMDRVTGLVAGDPALAAKLLQWANSAYSGGVPVRNLRAAISRVGLNALAQLVLSVEMVRSFGADEVIPGFGVELLNHHIGEISRLAAGLARAEHRARAALGGLFTHVGLLLEATHLPDRLAQAYELAEADGVTLLEAESRLFDVTHPELAGHLLSIWGLPSDLVLLAADSHRHPADAGQPPFEAPTAVRAGRLVAERLPHVAGIGSPHLDPVDASLADVLDGWLDLIPSATEQGGVEP